MTGREWLRRRGNVYAFLGLFVLAWIVLGDVAVRTARRQCARGSP